jgi:hypothetical protein
VPADVVVGKRSGRSSRNFDVEKADLTVTSSRHTHNKAEAAILLLLKSSFCIYYFVRTINLFARIIDHAAYTILTRVNPIEKSDN